MCRGVPVGFPPVDGLCYYPPLRIHHQGSHRYVGLAVGGPHIVASIVNEQC